MTATISPSAGAKSGASTAAAWPVVPMIIGPIAISAASTGEGLVHFGLHFG
jgi:hypothetical protein